MPDQPGHMRQEPTLLRRRGRYMHWLFVYPILRCDWESFRFWSRSSLRWLMKSSRRWMVAVVSFDVWLVWCVQVGNVRSFLPWGLCSWDCWDQDAYRTVFGRFVLCFRVGAGCWIWVSGSRPLLEYVYHVSSRYADKRQRRISLSF